MTALKMEQEQRFTRLESLLTSLVKGKAHMDEAKASTQSPTEGTHSNILPIQQLVIVEGNSLAIKKVEMHNFDGVDPIGWLARADEYFVLNNTREDMKVQLVLVCMEGPALHWLRWIKQHNSNIFWAQLTQELLQRYGGDMRSNLYERLATLRQNFFVDEYVDAFVALASQVEGLNDQQCLGFFEQITG